MSSLQWIASRHAELYVWAISMTSNSITLKNIVAVDVLLHSAIEHQLQMDFSVASELYEQVLTIQADHPEALKLRAAIAVELQDYEKALNLFDSDVLRRSDCPSVFNNRGISLMRTGKLYEAVDNFNQAIQHQKNYASAYSNRGIAERELRRIDAALESYNRAIDLSPDFADPYFNRGVLLEELGYPELAFHDYETAIQKEPGFIDALFNAGNLLYKKRQFRAALNFYDTVIAHNARHDKALYNAGLCLQGLDKPAEAFTYFAQAARVNPLFSDAHYQCGVLFNQENQPEAALSAFENAIAIEPDFSYLPGAIAALKMQICRWNNIDTEINTLLTDISIHKKISPPFPVLCMTDSLVLQRTAAETWVNDNHPECDDLGIPNKANGQGLITIGYFSSDFYQHATMHLITGLFKHCDRQRFKIIGFSFGPKMTDAVSTLLPSCFDQFVDVRDKSDREIAELARELGVDIAVDLKGYTQHHRFGIFSYRAAPIQVAYLGYPGTSAAPYMDYLIADRVVIPESIASNYSENIVYLPGSFQINDMAEKMSDTKFNRTQCGLPEFGFIFCCLCNSQKITLQTFAIWMNILGEVKDSVLWLLETNPQVAANLRAQSAAHGIAPDRLVFAQRMELSAHLSRQRLADLFLDTWPYGGHTTVTDALWAGVPVLTCVGESFASRVAASLLNALDLNDLVTHTPEDYAQYAIDLAQDTEALAAIKTRLETNRLSHPLFDTKNTVHHIETAYISMVERHRQNLPPASIDV